MFSGEAPRTREGGGRAAPALFPFPQSTSRPLCWLQPGWGARRAQGCGQTGNRTPSRSALTAPGAGAQSWDAYQEKNTEPSRTWRGAAPWVLLASAPSSCSQAPYPSWVPRAGLTEVLGHGMPQGELTGPRRLAGHVGEPGGPSGTRVLPVLPLTVLSCTLCWCVVSTRRKPLPASVFSENLLPCPAGPPPWGCLLPGPRTPRGPCSHQLPVWGLT